jgi:YhcG PDDEXK nuclease domain
VIDLKVEDFKPEFAGKMSFYLTAVDELQRQAGDEPSIGLVLCPGRRKTVTAVALGGGLEVDRRDLGFPIRDYRGRVRDIPDCAAGATGRHCRHAQDDY